MHHTSVCSSYVTTGNIHSKLICGSFDIIFQAEKNSVHSPEAREPMQDCKVTMLVCILSD